MKTCLAFPAKIVRLARGRVTVERFGKKMRVDISPLGEKKEKLKLGGYILVSGGLAVQILNKKEAEGSFRFISRAAVRG